MARRPSTSRPAQTERTDLYREITDRIVAQLEAGRVPWVQPWSVGPGSAGVAMPRNAGTGRAYSGVNVLLLWGAGIEAGYPTQRWLTFRQALALGACVRRGERGTTVVYADRYTPQDERARADRDGEPGRGQRVVTPPTIIRAARSEVRRAS